MIYFISAVFIAVGLYLYFTSIPMVKARELPKPDVPVPAPVVNYGNSLEAEPKYIGFYDHAKILEPEINDRLFNVRGKILVGESDSPVTGEWTSEKFHFDVKIIGWHVRDGQKFYKVQTEIPGTLLLPQKFWWKASQIQIDPKVYATV